MILEFKNVTGKTKHFNLQNVSFTLEPGYIMGLAGKNGAGKSTLIDYIMSPKKQYTGEILIEGINIRDKHYHMMNRIGFISDENTGFLFDKTAKENIELFAEPSNINKWEAMKISESYFEMGVDDLGLIEEEDDPYFIPTKPPIINLPMMVLMVIILVLVAVLCYSLIYIPMRNGIPASDYINNIIETLFV